MEDYTVCFKQILPLTVAEHGRFGGPSVDLFRFLSKSHNFSLKMDRSDSWMQDVLSERCDISVGLLAHHMMVPGIDSSLPYHYTNVHLLSRNLNTHRILSSSLAVNYEVLYGLAFLVSLLALVSYCCEKIFFINTQSEETSRTRTFCYFLWMYFSSIFSGGYRLTPQSVCSKILCAVWMFSLIIILSSIGGDMKADITTAKDSTVNTIQDMLDRSNTYPFIEPSSGLVAYFISQMKDKVSLEVLNRQKTPHFADVSSGKAVLIVDELYIVHILRILNTDNLHLSPPVFQFPCVVYFSSEIPLGLKELFNRGLIYFAATKQFHPIIRKTERTFLRKFSSPKTEYQELSFLIYLWLAGIATASTVFMLEIMFKYWQDIYKVYMYNE